MLNAAIPALNLSKMYLYTTCSVSDGHDLPQINFHKKSKVNLMTYPIVNAKEFNQAVEHIFPREKGQ